MPRTARVVLPGHLHHVTQRGNNRKFLFQDEMDCIVYLKRIEEYRQKCNVEIFAFCLMGNHVHFIVNPFDKESLARMFSIVHMRYAQYFQKKTGSRGHVWQGRFYSCLLFEGHIKEAIRYVETNPVRAKMVASPWDYRWSSACAHAQGGVNKWIKLGDIGKIVRVENWKQYLCRETDESVVKDIQRATKKCIVSGPSEFLLSIEKKLKIKLCSEPKGRPKIGTDPIFL